MQGTQHAPTPDTVRKIYRQVLRYAGSAVLYAHPARLNLRALYRPEFDVWMVKAKQGYEAVTKDTSEWEEFARRVNNTIAMCHHASLYKGTPPHMVTMNLANMRYYLDPHEKKQASSPVHLMHTLRSTRLEFMAAKKAKRQSERERVYAWDAFGEAVAMAEGSAVLLLGKAKPRTRLVSE